MKQTININPNLAKLLPRIFFSLIPVLLLSFLLSSELLSNTSAEQINVNIGDGAYYMNITADDLDIDIDATPSGVQNAVQKDIQVSTNSGTGYKIYLSMSNNDANGNRLYYNGDPASTNYISATSSASSLSGLTTNSWGYSKNYNSDTGTGDWAAVPLQGNEVLIGSADTSPSAPVTHSVYYGFNVNNTLPFGSYSGAVTYTAVADAAASPTAHTSVANYLDDKSMADPAGGDTLVITTSLMTNTQNFGDITVSVGGSNCPVTNTSTENKFVEISCLLPVKTAGSYAVAVNIPKFSKTYNTTITYAEAGTYFGIGFNKIRTMQGMTSGVCSNLLTPAAFQSDGTTVNANVPTGILRDTRDGKTYTVSKLADGNCWMSTNLALELATGTPVIASRNDRSTFTFTPTSCSRNGNCSMNQDTKYASSNGLWYYSWFAATAEVNNNPPDNTDTDGSICPVGWKLPSAYDVLYERSYDILLKAYLPNLPTGGGRADNVSTVLNQSPLNFTMNGFLTNGGSPQQVGTYGLYWGSTAVTNSSSGLIIISGVSAWTKNIADGKWHGSQVRCIAL